MAHRRIRGLTLLPLFPLLWTVPVFGNECPRRAAAEGFLAGQRPRIESALRNHLVLYQWIWDSQRPRFLADLATFLVNEDEEAHDYGTAYLPDAALELALPEVKLWWLAAYHAAGSDWARLLREVKPVPRATAELPGNRSLRRALAESPAVRLILGL